MAKVGAFIGSLAEQKDYVLEIKPKPKRRSLDANAYMWALIGKLQAELAKNDPQITGAMCGSMANLWNIKSRTAP